LSTARRRARATTATTLLIALLVALVVSVVLPPGSAGATAAATGAARQEPGAEPEAPVGEEPPPAPEQPPPAPPRPAPTGDGLPHIILRHQDPFVSPKGLLAMSLELQNAPDDALIWFSVRRSLTNNNDQRGLFDSIIAGKTRTDVVWPGTPFPVSLFERNADQTLRAMLPISSDGTDATAMFTIEDPGVYPVDVALLTSDRRELDKFTTFMVKLPPSTTEGASIEIATIVPFHAPLSRAPDGSTHLADDRRKHLDELTEVLAKYPTLPFTFNPRPETIEALHRTHPLAPTTADVAAAIRGREVLSSTFVDVDLDAWVASDLTNALGDQLAIGADVLRAHLNPSPPAERRTWQADSTLTPTALSQLRRFGVDHVVVPESSVAALDTKQFDAKQLQLATMQPFEIENSEGGRMRAFAEDARLASRLTATENPAMNAQYAIADLAILYFGSLSPSFRTPEPKKRGVVLAVPDDPRVLAALDRLMAGLATKVDPAGGGRAIIQASTLEEAFALERASTPKTNEPVVRAYAPTGVTAQSMGDFPEQLAQARHLIDGYRSMVATTAPERVRGLDELIQVPGAAGLTDAERRAYFEVVQREVATALAGVGTPGKEQVTLASTEAQIPIQFENALPYPVEVRVVLTSDNKLEFRDGNSIVTTLQPGVNKIPINVKAKASGLFTIEVKVLSPDSSLPLLDTQFGVRSTAVSGYGLALTIGAGFFLLLWWSRHWRDTRRARKLVGTTTTTTAAAA